MNPAPLLAAKEVAAFFGIHRRTLRHWCRRFKFAPTLTAHGAQRWTSEDVETMRERVNERAARVAVTMRRKYLATVARKEGGSREI